MAPKKSPSLLAMKLQLMKTVAAHSQQPPSSSSSRVRKSSSESVDSGSISDSVPSKQFSKQNSLQNVKRSKPRVKSVDSNICERRHVSSESEEDDYEPEPPDEVTKYCEENPKKSGYSSDSSQCEAYVPSLTVPDPPPPPPQVFPTQPEPVPGENVMDNLLKEIRTFKGFRKQPFAPRKLRHRPESANSPSSDSDLVFAALKDRIAIIRPRVRGSVSDDSDDF